jgi:hypothetical protein
MSRRWLVAVTAVVLAAAPARADRAVTGTVVDDATGMPVAGALVTIAGSDATTDSRGEFRIGELGFGRVDVVVVADGYRVYFGSARIGAVLAIRLEAADSASEVIRLSGRPPTGPPLHLDTAAIRSQPGAGNDVLRALQSLPGVARTPFGLGGLALRGTAPRDTKVYLDDIEVPLLYHFGGLASFLPTGAVDEVALEPGGASVRYGRGLGGVAIVTSRTGRSDQWRVGGEVSLLAEVPQHACTPVGFATTQRPFQLRALGDVASGMFQLRTDGCRPYTGAPGNELRSLGPPLDLTAFESAIYYGERSP